MWTIVKLCLIFVVNCAFNSKMQECESAHKNWSNRTSLPKPTLFTTYLGMVSADLIQIKFNIMKAEEITKRSTLLATIRSEFPKSTAIDLENELYEMINKALMLGGVVEQSEQLVCDKHHWMYRGERLDGRFVCERCGEVK